VHRLLGAGGDPFEADTLLIAGLGRLVARHAEPSLRAEPQHRHSVARQAMERLADQLLCPPTLAALATELELSRYQLLRRFAAEVGMPPYGWLAQHRVARARGLLDRGLPLGEVAAAVGFADQAHLTRWFRRVLGVTPGAYRNSVQDATGPGRALSS
jgi:AraC-like DNA-binding protein